MRRALKWLAAIALVVVAGLGALTLFGAYLRWDAARPKARGPYLQSVTPDSVWVVWDTTKPAAGQVEYGLTPDLGQVARSEEAGLHHAVQLRGLQPYTTYHYRADGRKTASFRTAAAPGQSAFRFVAYGDTRSGGSRHRAIVQRIGQAAPDFLIHTGDLVEAGQVKSEWDWFFRTEAPLLAQAPFYPTLGNHENYDPGRFESRYLDVFHLPGNELWYAFDYGHARFLCLKADGYPLDVWFPQGDQLAWLEGELAASEAPWLFVFFHAGVYTSRSEDFLELGTRERLVPLFEQYGVDAVFMGHHHSYERLEVNGVTYIVAAGGGASLYEFGEPEPGSQAAAQAYHFVQIDVDGDRLLGQAIDRDGRVIDAFELQAGP